MIANPEKFKALCLRSMIIDQTTGSEFNFSRGAEVNLLGVKLDTKLSFESPHF